MNVKGICLSGIVVMLSHLGVVHGQAPVGTYTAPGAGSRTGSAADAPSTAAPATTSLSSWILYDRSPGCCGPLGANGPIGAEIYFRTGVYFPLSSSVLSETLGTGWAITGGGRSLFFNPEQTAAWTADLGIINMYSNGSDRSRLVNVRDRSLVVGQGAVTSFNQTLASASFGREWYLTGCADPSTDHVNWRVGADAGGRYGTAKLETTAFRHESDTLGGMFLAIHSDVELPWGRCLLQGGIRAEYGYNWSDVFKTQDSADVQYINVLATLGVRF